MTIACGGQNDWGDRPAEHHPPQPGEQYVKAPPPEEEPFSSEETQAIVERIVTHLRETRAAVWAKRRREMMRLCDQLEFRLQLDIDYFSRVYGWKGGGSGARSARSG